MSVSLWCLLLICVDSRLVDSGTEFGSMVAAYWQLTRVEIDATASRMVDSMLMVCFDDEETSSRLRKCQSRS